MARPRPDPANATAAQITAWFARGDWTPTDFLGYCLNQIADRNTDINAVLDIYVEEARVASMRSTQRWREGKPISAIDGIPIGVKANIAVKGHVCHGGIKAYDKRIAAQDAGVITRLRGAGAIIFCSLNMEEGALGAQTDNPWFGKTHNPLRPGHTPGGSSGGSAAAVAAGFMPVSLGTDTMGSVRIPSSYCGIVGYKPSRKFLPTGGVMPLSTTLDTVGVHAGTLDCAALVAPYLVGAPQSFGRDGPGAVQFAPMDMPKGTHVEPDVARAFTDALKNIEDKTCLRRAPVSADYDAGRMRRAGLLISEVEGAAYHKSMRPEGFSPAFESMLAYGERQSEARIAQAYSQVEQVSLVLKDIFETGVDFIVAPTAPQTAFAFGDDVPANQADFTAPANFGDLPAISVPIGFDARGLPIGLQIMGPQGADVMADSRLFSFAKHISQKLTSA